MPTLPEISLPDFYTPEEKQYIQTGEWSAGTKSSLPLPSTSGESKLPISSTLDKPAVERQPSQLPIAKSRGENPLALVLSAISDIWTNSQGGKGTKLQDLATIQEAGRKQKAEERLGATEERKAKYEETRTQILQSAETRQQAQLHLTSSKELIKEASDFAATVSMLPDTEASKLRAAFRNRALQLGTDVADTVQAVMTQPEIGKIAGPYLEYLPSSIAPFQITKTAMLIRDNKVSEAMDELRGFSSANVMTAYSQRVAGIAAQLKGEFGEKKIPLSVVEAALGGRSDLPLLELHRGAEGIWAKPGYREWVSGTLAPNGIELPGLTAKVQETKAVETAKKEAAQPFEAGLPIVRLLEEIDKVQAKNPKDPKLPVLKAKLAKDISSDEFTVSVDKEGNVVVRQGPGGGGPASAATPANITKAQNTLDEVKLSRGLLTKLRQNLKPENVGLIGDLRGVVFGVGQQADAFSQLLIQEARGAAGDSKSKITRSTFFDPNLSKMDLLANLMAYKLARINNPVGVLSDNDFSNAEKALGLGKKLTGMNDILARLNVFDELITSSETIASERLGISKPGAKEKEDRKLELRQKYGLE